MTTRRHFNTMSLYECRISAATCRLRFNPRSGAANSVVSRWRPALAVAEGCQLAVALERTLIPVLKDLGVWSKYGSSTTWMKRLLPRIEGGAGGGCPILVFGITENLYDSGA